MAARQILCLAGFVGLSFGACSDDPVPQASAGSLDQRFASQVRPFFEQYCFNCHNPKKKKGDLDLPRDFVVAAIVGNPRQWEQVVARLHDQEMPPEDAKQPKAEDRQAAIAWLRELGDREARKHAGDPGIVLARRLSNAEFDTTIRDLTGVDIRPTREFPVDPANEAGFDNSGESLTMSEALLRKILAAARHVADHLVLKPEGFVFAPHPAVTDTDRDKYCVHRIIAFYQRHKVDYADYFQAAWRYQNRAALARPDATLADIAHDAGLSAKYLTALWPVLNEPEPAPGPLGEIQSAWRNLPAGIEKRDEVPGECRKIRDLLIRVRKEYLPGVEKMHVSGISDGSQPFVLWKNRQL